jgi:hypothetical protein
LERMLKMKYIMIGVALCVSCLMATGEISEDRLEELEDLIAIDSVSDTTEKTKSGKVEVVEIFFSSDVEVPEGIVFRIAVEFTDKEKNTYLVEKVSKYGRFSETYVGEGYWKLKMPNGSLERLKITGYAAENGVMDGKKFVPFNGDYDDVKTYEELTSRTTTPFPEKCSMGRTQYVDGY